MENLLQNAAQFEDGGPQPPTPCPMMWGTMASGMHTRQKARLSTDGETSVIGEADPTNKTVVTQLKKLGNYWNSDANAVVD